MAVRNMGMELLLMTSLLCLLSSTSAQHDSITPLMKLLNDGDENMKFLDTTTDYLVMLGVTGAGKSTLIKFITDHDKLWVVKKGTTFRFDDGGDKISRLNTISDTLVPEIFLDPTTSLALLDCPGFADTRDETNDIAAGYFVNKVFTKSENVKLVIVVERHSVSPNTDRMGLQKLLDYISQLLLDIDYYVKNNCLALVVTKVETQHTDSDIINEIVGLLTEIKGEYQLKIQQYSTTGENQYLEQNIKILNYFIKSQKIALFRVPSVEGLVSKSQHLVNSKNQIRKIIFQDIYYTNIVDQVFGFPLKLSSRNFITNTIYKEIYTLTDLALHNLNRKLITAYKNVAKKSDNIFEFNIIVVNLFNKISHFNAENVSRQKLIQLVDIFDDVLQQMSSNSLIAKKVQISNLIYQFDFFKKFVTSSDNDINFYEHCMTALIKTKNYINNLKLWYGILVATYQKLETYEIQKDKYMKFDLPKLLRNSFSIKKKSELRDFLIAIKDSNLIMEGPEYNELQETQFSIVDDFVVRDVMILLKLIQPNIICNGGCLRIESSFVTITGDVMQNLKIECQKPINKIEIFAMIKIFIDSDLMLNDRETHLSVMSPTWEVIGSRHINLNGSEGNDFKPELAGNDKRSGNGNNGVRGNPGNVGGSFYGIYAKIINFNGLSILTNGGKGGKGQNGGHGVDGKKGDMPQIKLPLEWKWELLGEDAFSGFESLVKKKRYTYTIDDYESSAILYAIYNEMKFAQTYSVVGEFEGSAGGNGGNGGKGGEGGNPGKISLIYVSQSYNIKQERLVGIEGHYGSGGNGGVGGIGRGMIKVRCKRLLETYAIVPLANTRCTLIVEYTGSNFDHGKNGIDNPNSYTLVKKTDVTPYEANILLVEFKILLSKTSYFEQSETRNLILKMNANGNNIKQQYDIKLLIEEVKKLEENSNLISEENMKLYLESFLKFLSLWNFKDDELTILNYLKASVKSSILNVQSSSQNLFLTDISAYLKSSKPTIESFNTLKNIKDIQTIQKSHSDSLGADMKETLNYIDNFLEKDIQDIERDLLSSTEKLTNEISTLTVDLNEHKEVLTERQEMREKNSRKLNILAGFKIASSIVSALGTYGAAVGQLAQLGINIAQELVTTDVDVPIYDHTKIPKGVDYSINDLKTVLERGITMNLEEKQFLILKEVTNYISKFPLLAKESKALIQEIEAGFKLIDPTIKTPISITNFVSETAFKLNIVLQPMNGSNVESVKAINRHVIAGAYIASTVIDSIRLNVQQDAKLEQIANALKLADQNIDKLKQYEEKVVNLIQPGIKIMFEDFKEFSENLKSKSSASLMIQNWNIKKYLSEIKFETRKFTENFKIEDTVTFLYSRLEEAANLVINLFDKIQNIQDRHILADYISEIITPKYDMEQKYKIEIQSLELVIKRNTIIAESKRIYKAYEQYVFPFASHYLDGKNPDFNSNSITDSISTSLKLIRAIENEIAKSKSSIKNNLDFFQHNAIFDSVYKSSTSFFVWNNQKFGNEISKFLSGQKVSLFADITSKNIKNCVKFVKINLKIKLNSEDVELAKELHETLKHFHIELTHLGNSNYKCNDLFFTIRSDTLSMYFSYETGTNNLPLEYNQVYAKILKGDILLSPYAMWEMKLKLLSDKITFEKFDKFKKIVDLELVGAGQYVNDNVKVCNADLEQYYQKYVPIQT